jgi:hypothetical protein
VLVRVEREGFALFTAWFTSRFSGTWIANTPALRALVNEPDLQLVARKEGDVYEIDRQYLNLYNEEANNESGTASERTDGSAPGTDRTAKARRRVASRGARNGEGGKARARRGGKGRSPGA